MFAAEYMYFKRCQNNLQKQMSSIPLEDVKLVWKKRQYHHQPRCVRSQYGKIKSLDLGTRKYTGKKKKQYIPDYPIDRGNKQKIHDENKNHVTQHDSQTFAWSPSTIFRKITILNTVLNINTMRIAKQRCSVFVILSDLDDLRIKKSRFSAPATNCLARIDFSWHCDFCRVPIDDFLKINDFEHGFEHQHDANCKKRCSIFMILIDLDDFRIKNHIFSAPATNCLVRVVEVVPTLKINVIRQLPRAYRFFVTFLWFL